jgi:CheY-like chemotaxis protein
MQMDLMANVMNFANGTTARVLIVDDERDGATSLGLLLKLRGHTVEVVTDSMQCLSALEAFKPDVVFLDIAMPRLTGYDIARQIRTLPDYRNIALIAMSGYADNPHKLESINSGCDQHLVKPLQLAEIEAAIFQQLQRRSMHRA